MGVFGILGDHSPGKPRKVREFQSGQGKVRGSVFFRCVFQALNTPKLVFRPGLCPGPLWGSLRCPPESLVGLGRGTPHPLPPAVTTPTVK